jgi:hypothetical protein
MEHRCGERLAVGIPAILRTRQGRLLNCTVEDLSCGGAFVRLPGDHAELHGLVELEMWLPYEQPQHCRWRACVMHQQPQGVGLMFDNLQFGDLLPFLSAERAQRRVAVFGPVPVSGSRPAPV